MTLLPVDASRARELVGRFSRAHILVVGDVMLDRFIVGRVTRISPEAPVPVVRFQREYVRLGGAANVARNVSALGGRVSLVGVIGGDEAARRLRNELSAEALSSEFLVEDRDRPTVEKTRIVTDRHQHVARIDYENDVEIRGDIEKQVLERVQQAAASADVVLVSDYLKGTVTSALMRSLAARKVSGTPVLVDPKVPHLAWYAGATLVTPNHQETEEATFRRIRTDDDARAAAADFREKVKCDAALVTRGEHGMWLCSDDANGPIAASARDVSDVTGAGDTVVATLALAVAVGASLTEAAVLANHAAGLVVAKFGPATINADELLQELTQ